MRFIALILISIPVLALSACGDTNSKTETTTTTAVSPFAPDSILEGPDSVVSQNGTSTFADSAIMSPIPPYKPDSAAIRMKQRIAADSFQTMTEQERRRLRGVSEYLKDKPSK